MALKTKGDVLVFYSHHIAGPTMAIVLLCHECESNMTIRVIDPTKKIETLARQCGWVRTAEGWICPLHNEKIERDYPADFGSRQQSSDRG
jgi:hypothetical protein